MQFIVTECSFYDVYYIPVTVALQLAVYTFWPPSPICIPSPGIH